jgi:hypothetical protein
MKKGEQTFVRHDLDEWMGQTLHPTTGRLIIIFNCAKISPKGFCAMFHSFFAPF